MDGKTQTTQTAHYNLDVIISVGYRVKSKQGTQFRIWPTSSKSFCSARLTWFHERGLNRLTSPRFNQNFSMSRRDPLLLLDYEVVWDIIEFELVELIAQLEAIR